MRKGLFATCVLAVAGLMVSVVGCNQPSQPEQKDVFTVSISNKTDLQAGDWYPDGNGRKIEVSITKNGEPQSAGQAYQDGDLTFTSSNTEVAKIVGQMVTPVAIGKTTIEALYGGQKDSVEMEVVAKPTNKDRFGTDHEGTLQDPFTNEDALKAAKFFEANGGFTTEEFCFRGEIESFYEAPGSKGDVCSWYYKPATAGGERFEIYQAKKADGSDWGDTELWVGAIVTAHGPFAKYKNQYETAQGKAVVDLIEGEKPADPINIDVNVAEAIAAGKQLSDGGSSWDFYTVTGYVVKKDDNNFYMADTKAVAEKAEDMLELYGVKDNTVLAGLLKNAKVTIKMHLKNYHGQIENSGSIAAKDFQIVEAGEPWEAPQGEKVTVTEALAKIKAVAAPTVEDFGSKTNLTKYVENEKLFEVSGIVTKLGTWSDSYGNGDAYIADAAGDVENTLQLFRISDKTVFDKLVVDQTKVKVTCKLAAFFKLVEGAVQFAAAETNQGPTVVIDGEQPQLEKLTVTEALAKIAAVAAPTVEDFGQKTNLTKYVENEKQFEVSGIVTKLGTWSDSYGNGDAYIADAAGDVEHTLQLFRISDKTVFDQLVVDETKVIVTCKLAAFFKLVEGAVQFAAAETNAGPAVVIDGGDTPVVPTIEPSSLEDPLTVAEAKAINLASGAFSPEEVYVIGTVEEAAGMFYNGAYFGKWNLVSGNDKIYVVNTKDNVATAYVGDEVIVKGYLKNDASMGMEFVKNGDPYPTIAKIATRGVSPITVGDHEHATVNAPERGENDSTFEFTVLAEEGYEIVDVKVNGVSANATEGKFTAKVQGPTEITVETQAAGAVATKLVLEKIGAGCTASAYVDDEADLVLSGGFTIAFAQAKKQSDALILCKDKGYFYNKTATEQAIASIELTTNSSASGKAKYGIAFSATAISAKVAASEYVNVAAASTQKYECSVENAQYFCISVDATANGQVLSLVINYVGGGQEAVTYAVGFEADFATVLEWNPVPTDFSLYIKLDDDTELLGTWAEVKGNLTGEGNVKKVTANVPEGRKIVLVKVYFDQGGVIKESDNVTVEITAAGEYVFDLVMSSWGTGDASNIFYGSTCTAKVPNE